MKQNLPAARLNAFVVLAIFALGIFFSACVTQTRNVRDASSVSLIKARETERVPRINLNTATVEELEKLPGVGKVVAERIVSHRQQYGPFRRAEHLMMVRGISDRKFRAMRELIVAY